MSKFPERIIAGPNYPFSTSEDDGIWNKDDTIGPNKYECRYVRKDLYDKVVSELKATKRNSYADLM